MISIKLAKEISLVKWRLQLEDSCILEVSENKARLLKFRDEYPTLYNHHNCGFCLRHGYSIDDRNPNNCINCEISRSEAKCCLEDNSLYSQIEEKCFSDEERKQAIKQLIAIIENIPEND